MKIFTMIVFSFFLSERTSRTSELHLALYDLVWICQTCTKKTSKLSLKGSNVNTEFLLGQLVSHTLPLHEKASPLLISLE